MFNRCENNQDEFECASDFDSLELNFETVVTSRSPSRSPSPSLFSLADEGERYAAPTNLSSLKMNQELERMRKINRRVVSSPTFYQSTCQFFGSVLQRTSTPKHSIAPSPSNSSLSSIAPSPSNNSLNSIAPSPSNSSLSSIAPSPSNSSLSSIAPSPTSSSSSGITSANRGYPSLKKRPRLTSVSPAPDIVELYFSPSPVAIPRR